MLYRALISSMVAIMATGAFVPATAQEHHHAHHASETAAMPHPQHAVAARGNAATRTYETAMATMHKNMDVALSGNADVDFARQMLPHHQAAVDMAKVQLQYGHDERLKQLSRWIIFTQEIEIGFMKNWLYRRDNGLSHAGATDYYAEVMATMHHAMMMDYTGDADVDFVRGMIPHHQGAADMASILLANGTDPDLNRLANDIFSTQSYEISWMQGWLAEHGK